MSAGTQGPGCMCPQCGSVVHPQPQAFEHPLIEAVKVLTIKPGDVVVLKVPGNLGLKEWIDLKRRYEGFLPDGARVMILENGVDIEVIRQEVKDGA